MTHQAERLGSTIKKVGMIAGSYFGIKALFSFGKQAVSLASDIDEVQNVVDTAFDSMTAKMEEFASTAIETYGISKLTAKQTGSTFMAMANGMGLSAESASDMAIALTGLSADMASFYNVEQSVASVALKSIFTGETETLKQYGIVMTEVNLQEFARQKGIQKTYKNMSQAEKVQLRYNYVMAQTKQAQGDFAKTSDSWANQTRILSERWKEFQSTIGTTLIPTLKIFVTYLSSAIAKLQTFANVMQKVFGKKQTETTTKGIANITSETDSLTDSTKALNKANKALLGDYDELSVVSSNTDTSSITEGLGDTGDISSLTDSLKDTQEQVDETTEKLEKFFNYFKEGNYGEIGKTIANKITEQLRNIDWQKIYGYAKNFGSGFANFLNGLFNENTFIEVAKTIARLLNTRIYATTAFFKDFNWGKFGANLAKSLNTFLEEFDFVELTEGINAFLNGIIDAVSAFIHHISFESIINAIVDVLFTLDWSAVVQVMSTIIATKWIGKALKTGAANIKKIISEKFLTIVSQGLSATSVVGGIGLALVGAMELAIDYARSSAQYWEDYFNWLVDTSFPTEAWQTKIDEIVNASEDLVNNTRNRLKKLDDVNLDFAVLKSMSDRYFELYQQEHKSNEELSEMQSLHDTMISNYPELKDVLDKEGTDYYEIKKSVDDLIDSLLLKAQTKAAEELLTQAYKDQLELQKNLVTAEENHKKATDEYWAIWPEYKKKQERFNELTKDAAFLTSEEEEELQELNRYLEDNKEAVNRANAARVGTKDALKIAQEALNENQTEIERYTSIYVKKMDTIDQKGKETAQNAGKNAQDTVKNYADNLKDKDGKISKNAGSLLSLVTNKFNDVKSKFTEIGKYITQGLTNGINDPAVKKELDTAVYNLGSKNCSETLRKVMGIASPSKVFKEYGYYIDKGLAVGINDNVGLVEDATDTLSDSVLMPTFATGTELPKNNSFNRALTSSMSNSTDRLAELINNSNDKDIVVQIDGREVFRAVKNQSSNYTKMTGQPAF